jgi:hypothetical protein
VLDAAVGGADRDPAPTREPGTRAVCSRTLSTSSLGGESRGQSGNPTGTSCGDSMAAFGLTDLTRGYRLNATRPVSVRPEVVRGSHLGQRRDGTREKRTHQLRPTSQRSGRPACDSSRACPPWRATWRCPWRRGRARSRGAVAVIHSRAARWSSLCAR